MRAERREDKHEKKFSAIRQEVCSCQEQYGWSRAK